MPTVSTAARAPKPAPQQDPTPPAKTDAPAPQHAWLDGFGLDRYLRFLLRRPYSRALVEPKPPRG